MFPALGPYYLIPCHRGRRESSRQVLFSRYLCLICVPYITAPDTNRLEETAPLVGLKNTNNFTCLPALPPASKVSVTSENQQWPASLNKPAGAASSSRPATFTRPWRMSKVVLKVTLNIHLLLVYNAATNGERL